MSYRALTDVLEALQTLVYGGAVIIAFVHWRRHRSEASAWLAATFAVLGVVIVVGRFLPEDSTNTAVLWVGKVMIGILVLFPYFLYRFMATFIRPARWIWLAAPVLTAAVALGGLLLPDISENNGPRPVWLEIYIAALLIQWVFLSGVVAVRLWRAGRDQPSLARKRMRTMSLGAAALSLALVIAGEFSAETGATSLLVQLLALAAAPLMVIGFAPPYILRTAWRRREEGALNEAVISLMKTTTAAEVGQTLLPHVRQIVGAEAAALHDAKGRVIAGEGEVIVTDPSSQKPSHESEDPLQSSNGRVIKVPMNAGQLTVTASRFTPFFGHEEMAAVQGLAGLADLALARNEILDSQKRLAQIVESSNDAIIAKSLDGTITSWNDGAERLYGYSAAEAIGRRVSILVPSDRKDEIHKVLEKIGRNESIEHYETQRQTKNGDIIDVSLTISPIRDSAGTVTGASTIARDITELKQVEDALRQSEERSRTVVDTANDAYIEIGSDSLVRDWNAAAVRMFGITRSEALGANLTEMIIPPRYREKHRDGMAAYLRTGEGPVLNTTTELSALRNRIDEFPVEVTIWPVKIGSEVTFHAFVRDITERKAAEAAIRAAQGEADRANRAKSEFLSRMSHELRTPLNAILGFAQLLDMDPLNGEQKESMAEIIKGGKHLLDLINEVLDISRIEVGGLRLSLEPVDAIHAVEECISLLTPLANQEGVSLRLDHSGLSHSAFYVTADRQRLKQVLLNLISNGIKYNRQDGTVHVTFDRVEQGHRVRINVADSGHGIAADRMERLFAAFERLGAEASGIEGTGLGLALSKPLVEAMGGTLSATSEVGHGTTFSLEFDAANDPNGDESSSSEKQTSEAASPASKTVLYIEDNLSNLKLVERLVKRRSHIVLISAMQGGMGVTLARDHKPDLILLDLNLPDLPGGEVLARLHSDGSTAELPVVVISADATSGQIERLVDAGARDYLTKPIDVNRFFEVLDEYCSES